MTPNNKLYAERANGRIEAWWYSDGERVYVIAPFADFADVQAYARKHQFDLVEIL